MNSLDLIVVGVIAASALLAFFRGFVREVLAVGAWVGAIAVAFYLTVPTRGFLHSLIGVHWIADYIVWPITLFVVALVIFSLITGFLTSQIRYSQLSAVDRTLGFGFGVARGMLVVCLAYIALNYFIAPENRPPWIAQARTLPFLDMGVQELEAMVPRDVIKHSSETAQEFFQKAQSAQKLDQDLNGLTTTPPDQQPSPPASPPPANPQGQRQQSAGIPSTPPAYSDKMSDQMDQAVQQAIGKQ